MSDYSRDFLVRFDEAHGSATIRFRCFDTPNAITVYRAGSGLTESDAERLLLSVRGLCLDLHALWSFSSERSDIARINAAGTDPVEVDVHTIRLLRSMRDFNEREPLFDFTIGTASFLWKHRSDLPASDEVEEALAHVGVGKLRIGGHTVAKEDPLLRVDVGGAAKGYAADAVTALLREAGVSSADVDLGGNVYLLGDHPDQRPWRLEVRVPEGVPAGRILIDVSDRTAVTSGSYERYSEIDGRKYQHIVDPRTGWPSESDIVSATVVSESSLEADMLATTTLLSGTEGLRALEARHPACRFIVILPDGTVHDSVR